MTKLLVVRKKELKVPGHKVELRPLVSKDKKECAVSVTVNGYEFRSPQGKYYQDLLKEAVSDISRYATDSIPALVFMPENGEGVYRARLLADGAIRVSSSYPEAAQEVLEVTTVEQLHAVVEKFNLAL